MANPNATNPDTTKPERANPAILNPETTNRPTDHAGGEGGHHSAGSALARILDENYETIAARRSRGDSWQPVLDWLAHNAITDTRGRPVTPQLLAATWARVGAIRDARGLGRPRPICSRHSTTEGSSTMASTEPARRVAFSEAFSQALEDTDRHSPLYRFMVENYDAIAEKRSRYGSWDKFLDLVNEAGIRDGQDRPVTVRVLYRTWERVSRAVKASRSRPAARIATPPNVANPPRPPDLPKQQFATPPSTRTPLASAGASIVSRPGQPPMITTRKWQAHMAPLEREPLPPGKSAQFSYEQAWTAQHFRNDYYLEEKRQAFATLQQDLVNDLTDAGFAVYIARFDADATGERVLAHLAERQRIMDELKKEEAHGRTNT
jgi:hypothetical protein